MKSNKLTDGSQSLRSHEKASTCLVLLLGLMACVLGAPIRAATPVAADVASDTTWNLAGSPYVVSGNIAVTGNAVLTIDAGVVVQFEAAASLRVAQGSLSAHGQSTSPIVFTSIEDVAQGTPTPGDWGALSFGADTNDAATSLSHVAVRYGQGIVIEDASPTFNDMHIENCSGPAISMDLASSPIGQGLVATGNQINGIVVPAGTIDSEVVWGLRGIPYVLEQGTINVGRPVFALSPSRLQLSTGVVATLAVTIPDPAPAGGFNIDLVSSIPSVASVPATVTIAEGERSAQLAVTAQADGETVISASAPGFGTVTADVQVEAPQPLQLTPESSVISMQSGGHFTVSTPEVAPAGGRDIALTVTPEGIIDVPGTVTLAPGATSAGFDIAGLAEGTASLTASSPGFTPTSATVTVRPVSLNPPSELLVTPGSSRSMPILLTDAAPGGGLTISLVSDNTSVATVPVSALVPAGESSVNVDVQGVAVGTATVTASAPGYESGASLVRVEQVTIETQPAGSLFVPKGMASAPRTVRISTPAPAGGLWVEAQTGDALIASVAPQSVFIPQGEIAATETIVVTGIAEGVTELQLSSAGLVELVVDVEVGPPAQLEFTRASVVVGKGLRNYYNEVYLRRMSGSSAYQPSTPLTVTLTSSDPAKVGVPATITIPAGQYLTRFTIEGLGLSITPVEISATAPGYAPPQTPLQATVVTPELQFGRLEGSRAVGEVDDEFYVSWYVPGAQYPGDQTALADQTIDLSIVEASPAGLVGGLHDGNGDPVTNVVIGAGQNDSGWVYVDTPTEAGTYKVAGSLTDVGSWISGLQTVVAPSLVFTRADVTVGIGMRTYVNAVYVRLEADGGTVATSTPLTVALTSSDPAMVGVPATITIPAGESSARFTVEGLGLTSAPIEINASAPGSAPPQTPLQATVVTPELQFVGLEGSRAVGEVADGFGVRWYVPGAHYPLYQIALAEQTIDLSIVEASPAGIVDGFRDGNGDPVTSVVIDAGQNDVGAVYVDTPNEAGTYKVAASLTGVGSWISGLQTVVAPSLEFTRADVTVGNGMRTYVNAVYVRLVADGGDVATSTPLTVTLTNSDPTTVGVPATVTIPAGEYQTRVSVEGLGLTSAPVEISATAPGYAPPQAPLQATVVTPELRSNGLEGSRAVGEVGDRFYISWYVPGAHYPSNQTALADQMIDLSIVEASPAGLVGGFHNGNGDPVTSVAIDAGQNSIGEVYVDSPTEAGTYKVAASLTDVGSMVSGLQTVVAPSLAFSRADVTVGIGMQTYIYTLNVRRVADGDAFSGVEPVVVSLQCVSTLVCTVPETVTIPAGQQQKLIRIAGAGLGATEVVANATGYLAAQNLEVTTVEPQVGLSGLPASLADGTTDNFSVYLRVPGAHDPNNQTAAESISIDLTTSRPAVATVPAEITVAQGENWISAVLTAVDPGTTTVTASGLDLLPATSGTIEVQQP